MVQFDAKKEETVLVIPETTSPYIPGSPSRIIVFAISQ